jgi:hypothetical protein
MRSSRVHPTPPVSETMQRDPPPRITRRHPTFEDNIVQDVFSRVSCQNYCSEQNCITPSMLGTVTGIAIGATVAGTQAAGVSIHLCTSTTHTCPIIGIPVGVTLTILFNVLNYLRPEAREISPVSSFY